jgi:hypothetical protein
MALNGIPEGEAETQRVVINTFRDRVSELTEE